MATIGCAAGAIVLPDGLSGRLSGDPTACDWLRKERGEAASRSARGPGGGGDAEGRPDLPGVGLAAQRPGERRHHAQGAGLPAEAGIYERLLCEEGPASV